MYKMHFPGFKLCRNAVYMSYCIETKPSIYSEYIAGCDKTKNYLL